MCSMFGQMVKQLLRHSPTTIKLIRDFAVLAIILPSLNHRRYITVWGKLFQFDLHSYFIARVDRRTYTWNKFKYSKKANISVSALLNWTFYLKRLKIIIEIIASVVAFARIFSTCNKLLYCTMSARKDPLYHREYCSSSISGNI